MVGSGRSPRTPDSGTCRRRDRRCAGPRIPCPSAGPTSRCAGLPHRRRAVPSLWISRPRWVWRQRRQRPEDFSASRRVLFFMPRTIASFVTGVMTAKKKGLRCSPFWNVNRSASTRVPSPKHRPRRHQRPIGVPSRKMATSTTVQSAGIARFPESCVHVLGTTAVLFCSQGRCRRWSIPPWTPGAPCWQPHRCGTPRR